jgi:hypothetical protein
MTADEVDRQVERFEGAVAAVHRSLVEAIEREVTSPLKEAARGAAEEHKRLTEAATLGAPNAHEGAADQERERVWRLVREHSEHMRDHVLVPLHARLADIDVGQRLAECLAEARRGLTDAASAAPVELTREEPGDTYHRDEGDHVLRRGRKALVRAGRSLEAAGRSVGNLGRRLRGKDRSPPPTRAQVVPLRTFLHYHTTSRLAAGDDEVVEVLRRRLARYLSDCERDVSAWTETVLDVDAALDRPAHHASTPHDTPSDRSDAPDAEDDGESEPPTIRAEAVERAASTLGSAIGALANADPLADLEEGLAAAAAAARPSLLRDLRQVGTFMLDPARRASPERPTRVAREAAARESDWTGWYRQVVSRIELDIHLERVREQLLGILDAFDSDMESTVVDPVRAMLQIARQTLTTVRGDVESSVRLAREKRAGTELRDRLTAARDTVTGALETHVLEPIRSSAIDASIREHADGRVGEIVALLGSLPEALVVHQPAAQPEAVEPDAKSVEIRLRQIAEQAYDAVLLERFRVAPDPMVATLDRVREETHRLGNVIRFNLDSALEELDADEGDLGERLGGAQELALNGLDRTLGTLDELRGAIAAELPRFRQRLFEAHARGWEQLHGRVGVEDRMQEQILDFRYRARSELRQRTAALSTTVRRATRRGMTWVRLGRGRAMRLVRLGQSALEGERVTEEQKRRTIDALSTLDEVLGDLPLVYRRLFSFQPVSDVALLEGRASDVEALTAHFAHWREGLTDAFVVTGYDGNGRSSFINVVAETVLREADVRRVRLTERVLDEGVFAGRLAEALGVDDRDAWTFGRLAVALSRRNEEDGKPLVCIIENLEHLLLRTSSDNGLVGPFLAFMSRFDSSVFWLATLAEPAWHYIEKVESGTACLVRRHALAPLGRSALEAVIMNRHKRSGLRLEFLPPAVTSSLLRRRLSRAHDHEERQVILRAEYFDLLARLTGQNLLLAIFYWVRSVHLDPETSTVRVRAIEPVSFAFIDAFTLSQSFTLKAFLDHATLSLAEHDRIFRMSHDESHHLFESLGNLLVIEPAQTSERVSQFVFTTVDDEQRYRIRPLVVHPVLTHLRSKNIVT